jgi:8-oxo-dGTP diphosphatase
MGDGDGWVRCLEGHRHWGRFGAAGLLLTDGSRTVLQHRAPWTHEGGTWGLPGGARDSHEDPVETALREAAEEAAVDPQSVAPTAIWIDDHGGWSYTTVAARPRGEIRPHSANAESTEVRWWPSADVDTLPLHYGLERSWPRLRQTPPPLGIVVDAANVIGSRPNGWWRDRLAAARRLRADLGGLARHGIEAEKLPPEVCAEGMAILLPWFRVVVEGAARPAAADPVPPGWWSDAVTILAATRDGDERVLTEASEAAAQGVQTLVVSADRGLRAGLPQTVRAVGPGWLTGLLPSGARTPS